MSAQFFFRLTTLSLLITGAATAQASELDIVAILKQGPGALPTLALARDRLIYGQNESHKHFVASIGSDGVVAAPIELEGSYGNTSIIADEASGWVVSCAGAGSEMFSFQLDSLKVTRVEYPEVFGCGGLSLEPVRTGAAPVAWLGSGGDRTVARVDVATGRVLRAFTPISGPFHLNFVNGRIFALNELVFAGSGVPYIFDATSGAPLVGDALGRETTSVTRGYGSKIFDDSSVSGKVYMIRQTERELHAFSAADPSESAIEKTALGQLELAHDITRYGQCLVVLGTVDAEWRWPQWTVLRPDANGALQVVKTTEHFEDKRVNGAIRQEIDSHGNIYLAHWKGVTQVRGLLTGLGCE